MSNWNASKHLWLNSFGSQSAVREISCGTDHTYLLIYAIEETQFWDSQGGWLLSLPFRKKKISVRFIQNISDYDMINLSLDPHWPGCPKQILGEYAFPTFGLGGCWLIFYDAPTTAQSLIKIALCCLREESPSQKSGPSERGHWNPNI